ncbi:hypothetical protein F5J12DRAFT_781726 [Pisolithus orientalis]|uniref:uncharacterized protein n=1 Tax=Pisolithus orientalis TaxID=936130 RepID=UPI002224886C|nr:uncharacterized protein F5J12DRAFT_781726 [Pisolithus orientalis]KAI6010724.1 hypothetical protein F5J12DRAFT_781726 [Pisolithus orientalis]
MFGYGTNQLEQDHTNNGMASSNHSTNCVNTSDEEDFCSDEESSLDSMETTKSAPGKLRLDKLQILQDGLNDWKEADTNKRASLMEGMWNKIKWLDTNKSLKQNEWNRKWTAIKHWMYNNSWSCAWKALVKYGSKWMALKVIKLQCKKDIQQVLVKARIHPGMSAMIKHYQPAIQKVVQSLTKAELDQAAHLAKEAATSKGQKYAKQFAYDMWKQCGMRVVIMSAWKDKEGEVMVGVNDFNDELGDGELYLDWEDLHGKWSAYAKKAFGANGTEDGSREDEASQTTVKAQKGKKQSQFSLSTNDDGTPILPNLLDLQTPELKDIMRAWLVGRQMPVWRSQDGSLEELVTKHQHWSDKAKGKRPWMEVNSLDGSDYGHHSEEEPAPPTKPSTKQQRIDDWHNMATAYPKPADNHANDGGNLTARKPKPKPRIRSNGVDPVGRNSNARPRCCVMDREDGLLDQAEEDGVAHCPEQNHRPPWWPDDNYPTPTMRSQFVHFSNSIQHNLVWFKMVACLCLPALPPEDLLTVARIWNFWTYTQLVEYQLLAVWQTPGRLLKLQMQQWDWHWRWGSSQCGDWNGGGNPKGSLCNGIPGATGSGNLSHAGSSNGVLSERCVDMESQGGSTNGLLEEGDGANDSHAGAIKGDLGEPEDWKEGGSHNGDDEFIWTAGTESNISGSHMKVQNVHHWNGQGGCQGYNAGTERTSGPGTLSTGANAAQLVGAQLGMVHTVVEHLPLAFKIPPHLIAINMHMPKSHPYYKVMEELTRPSSRAKHQAQLVDKGKGKELGMDEAQRIWLLDTMARTTGVVMQKLGNEEDQNREKAQGCSQSRCGQPVAKPVDASDQTSRGWSQSRRPMKKAKPAVNKDVQDHPSKVTSCHSSPGPWTGCPMEIITLSWLSQSWSHARSVATDPPITPAPTTTTGADDPCHCDKYQEEVTIIKQENSDMRQEIEMLSVITYSQPQMCLTILWSHFTLLPTLHWYLTCQSMVELGTATSVVEVQSSQSGSRQESTEPPPQLHLREVLAWKYLLQMSKLCMDLLEVWQSLLLHHHQQSDQCLDRKSSGHHQSHHCGNTCISGMVLVPVHTHTVDLLPGGQAGQAWHGIISGQASMALALGWHSWHWFQDSLTDGLMALGMCQNSLQWCCDSLHDGLMALGMCWNIWHRCWDHFHGIGVVLEHITMVPGWLA